MTPEIIAKTYDVSNIHKFFVRRHDDSIMFMTYDFNKILYEFERVDFKKTHIYNNHSCMNLYFFLLTNLSLCGIIYL